MAKYKKRSDGRYATTIRVGVKPDGRPDNVFLSAKSEKELKEKVIELKMKMKEGRNVKTSDMLFGQYAQQWLETYKSMASMNTRAMYQNALKVHILPAIGDYPINKIVRSDVQSIINKQQEHPKTCKNIKMTISQILESAIDDKLIVENVSRKVILPKLKKTEKRALTDVEKEAIKKAGFTDRERLFVLLLYYFGLRRGEALALTKSDVDFKTGLLTVNKAVVYDVNRPIIKIGAKSDAGDRSIPIPDSAKADLLGLIGKADTLYLFAGENAQTLSKTQYVHMWNQIIKKMNDAVATDAQKKIGENPIKGLTAHIFRHNYATMLYYSGISHKKAAELMGHSDIKMIMEVYAHLDEKKEAVQAKLSAAVAL